MSSKILIKETNRFCVHEMFPLAKQIFFYTLPDSMKSVACWLDSKIIILDAFNEKNNQILLEIFLS